METDYLLQGRINNINVSIKSYQYQYILYTDLVLKKKSQSFSHPNYENIITELIKFHKNSGMACSTEHCKNYTVYVCQNVEWKRSIYPNLLGQTLLEAEPLASLFWHQIHTISCSSEFQFLVCSVLAPPCIPGVTAPIPPCRELCDLAVAQCLPIMKQYGLTWPENSFQCQDFPLSHQSPCLYFRHGEIVYPPGVISGCEDAKTHDDLPDSSPSDNDYDEFYIDYDTATVTKTFASTLKTIEDSEDFLNKANSIRLSIPKLDPGPTLDKPPTSVTEFPDELGILNEKEYYSNHG